MTIGNFWVDLTRTVTRILLPLSVVFALIFVAQGMIQNFDGFTDATTLEGADSDHRWRAVRQPGGDQGARHERRRLAQRQLRTPVREP